VKRAWHRYGLACAGLCLAAGAARADFDDLLDVGAPGRWRALVGPLMVHWNPSPEHTYVWAVAVERQRDDQWLYGASYFSNSFGQPSGFLYFGKQYPDVFDVPKLYFQWSAGLLYGYKGRYQDKVPANYDGFSPGAVIGFGWQIDPTFAVQVNAVGTAGLMLQLSYEFR
jgi:hypothetical protein